MREPVMCGGTTRHYDSNAPKEIKSTDMLFFKAESELPIPFGERSDLSGTLEFISAFAAKLEGGSFLLLETLELYEKRECSWAFVSEDVFPALVKLVNDEQLAKGNGEHSFTHGLPKNFGGEVKINYADGEVISFSDNQCPILSMEFGVELRSLFSEAMKTAGAPLPCAESITAVKFFDENDFGYTRCTLKPNDEGGYTLNKIYKFEEPKLYEYTKNVSGDVIERIRAAAEKNAVLLWDRLPQVEYKLPCRKALTFVFEDGSEQTISDDRTVPSQLYDAFYAIERELTV